MTATVRPATPEDWDGFIAAFESVAAEGRWIGSELPIDRVAMRPSFEARTADDQFLLLVAVSGDLVVGWTFSELPSDGRASLGMGIVEGHRSVGLGTEMLARVIAWARERGAHKVTLEVWEHNDRARRLYETFGFEIEGRHRRHWRRRDGSLWDSLAMGLVLDEESPGGPDR